MLSLILTLLIGAATGLLLYKLKIPGGIMVGAMLGSCVFNLAFGHSSMPVFARVTTQIFAGAFIACTLEKGDIKRLRYILKPASVLVISMLVLNIVMGFIIHAISGLDPMTAFFCAVPGGVSDTPIIAIEMGANGGIVALAQFARLAIGIGVFPSVIMAVTRGEPQSNEHAEREITSQKSCVNLFLTTCIAMSFGILGYKLKIPVGALLFSLCGVTAFKQLTDRAFFPIYMRRLAQLLAGTYIGCSMTLKDIGEIKIIIIPVLLLIAAYAINCFFIGYILHRFFNMSLREGMLAATPAGASDMALLSSDLNVQSSDLVVLQILRMVTVVSIFPQIVNLIVAAM